MEISRYPQTWINSSPYVRRVLAVFFSLPMVKQRRHPLKKLFFKTVASWEARGLPLDLVLFGMVQCILERLESQKARPAGAPRLGGIGYPAYFEPAIANYQATAEESPQVLTWAQLSERARAALALVWGWQDPGVNWPPETDPKTGRTIKYQKRIQARAAKWGCSLAEAEARMIERARARAPRQKRLPLSRQETKDRARARANRKTMPNFLL